MSIMIMKALMGFHEEWKVILYNSTSFPTMSTVVRISPHYKGKNGSLVPIGHKGRFLPLENSKKQNVKMT